MEHEGIHETRTFADEAVSRFADRNYLSTHASEYSSILSRLPGFVIIGTRQIHLPSSFVTRNRSSLNSIIKAICMIVAAYVWLQSNECYFEQTLFSVARVIFDIVSFI